MLIYRRVCTTPQTPITPEDLHIILDLVGKRHFSAENDDIFSRDNCSFEQITEYFETHTKKEVAELVEYLSKWGTPRLKGFLTRKKLIRK